MYLRDRPLLDGSHGNLSNYGDVDSDSDGYSKLDCSSLYPSSSSNDRTTARIPYVIDSIQGKEAPLLSSFIQNPAIFTAGSGVASSDNVAFGINIKSDAISGNRDFIPRAYVQVNKNVNSTGVELVVKLSTIKQGYFSSRKQTTQSQNILQLLSKSNTPRAAYIVLYAMPLAVTFKNVNLILEKFDEIITVYYCRYV